MPQQYSNVQSSTYPEVYPQPPNPANVQSNTYQEAYPQPPNPAYSRYSGYQPQQQTHMFVPQNTPVDTQVFVMWEPLF